MIIYGITKKPKLIERIQKSKKINKDKPKKDSVEISQTAKEMQKRL